jgi:hypothetical protein
MYLKKIKSHLTFLNSIKHGEKIMRNKIQKNKIKTIVLTTLALVVMCAVTQTAEAASKIDSSAYGYSNFFEAEGKFLFITDDNGNKWTIWIGDDGTSAKRKGHERFAIDTTKTKNPLPADATDPDGIKIDDLSGLDVDVNIEGAGLLRLGSNQPVTSSLVDVLTGNTITTITIDSNSTTTLQVGDLERNKIYSILSVTNAGMTDGKTFILNNDNTILISE